MHRLAVGERVEIGGDEGLEEREGVGAGDEDEPRSDRSTTA